MTAAGGVEPLSSWGLPGAPGRPGPQGIPFPSGGGGGSCRPRCPGAARSRQCPPRGGPRQVVGGRFPSGHPRFPGSVPPAGGLRRNPAPCRFGGLCWGVLPFFGPPAGSSRRRWCRVPWSQYSASGPLPTPFMIFFSPSGSRPP